MSNIFKKIKDQQKRNEIKKKEEIENEKFIKYINKPIPTPKPIRLINMELSNIDNFRYRVVTKDDFIRYMVNSKKASNITKNTFKVLEEAWNKTRRGYNFVIAVGNEELMFYSIDSFNEHIGSSIDDKK